jgi:hypothetical protein
MNTKPTEISRNLRRHYLLKFLFARPGFNCRKSPFCGSLPRTYVLAVDPPEQLNSFFPTSAGRTETFKSSSASF